MQGAHHIGSWFQSSLNLFALEALFSLICYTNEIRQTQGAHRYFLCNFQEFNFQLD